MSPEYQTLKITDAELHAELVEAARVLRGVPLDGVRDDPVHGPVPHVQTSVRTITERALRRELSMLRYVYNGNRPFRAGTKPLSAPAKKS